MTTGGWLAACLLAGAGALGAASCKDNPSGHDGGHDGGGPSTSAGSSTTSAVAPAASEGARPSEGGGDDVRPVYPVDNKPPLPLAERYCDAVRVTPARRRAECCPAAGAVADPIGECVRTLSSAFRSGAVTLDPGDLDACAAAVARETAGCDWVTSAASPTASACLGILKGTVKEGALCRSNLECEEGMRCRALGATRPGKCAPPLPSQRVCNIATDSLAAFTGQDDLERRHPECAGQCLHQRCVDAIAAGASCTRSAECGPAAHCVAGKCAAGALPGPGQACTDACASGARCWKGKCLAPRAGGEACEDDAECRAHCERGDGGKVGKCAGQCPSFPAPPAKGR